MAVPYPELLYPIIAKRMNLRSKLFKKPWQNRDPEVRAEAVRRDPDPELKPELARLAQTDEAAIVRLAALQRLNSEPFWLDARLRESDAEIIRAADQFLAREIPRTEKSDLEHARIEWLNLIADSELLRRLASSCPATAIRRAALERIAAPGFLGDCYIREPDDELAAELLTRIDQFSTLDRVVQQARRSNKRRAQAAAERLESLRVADGSAAPGQAASERLVEKAESLARGHGHGDLNAELADLRAHWDRVGAHPEALALRFEGAIRIIEAALQRRRAVTEEPHQDVQPADAEPLAIEAGPDARLVSSADFIRTSLRTSENVDARDLLAHWDRTWNQLRAPGPADEAVKAEILPLLRELQAQVQINRQLQGQKAVKPGTGNADPSQDGGTARATVSFATRLDEIAESLESGDLQRAHEQIRTLRSEHDRLPGPQRSAVDSGRLQRMEGRLKEMRNWQHWSNNKIRDELIARVEQLSDSGQHPDAIMAALKQARAEWQRLEALETVPGDKRRFTAPPGQWRQFQTACKQAYKASQPYLEKRHQLLRENLETLQAFIAAGLQAAADEATETGTLLGFMRKARQAIRRMDDLPPKARGASASGLRELMNTISGALDQRFEAVESVKRKLVTEARALSHEKDIKAAVDKAKALQSQWQKAGSGRRKVEQELWRQFREPIDPLFQQLKGEQDQRRQADREAHAELKALCEQAEALAELPDAELEGAHGRLLGLIDEWLRQEARPESLNRRFERAEQRFEQRVSAHQAKLRQRAAHSVHELADLVQKLWTMRCQDQGEDLSAQLPAERPADPVGADLYGLAQRLAAPDFAPAALQEQVQVNARSARQIAVEFEFLSGLETPSADQALRMNYQVQRLARRMSARERQPDLASELRQLQQRWCRCLPLPTADYKGLQSRVEKAQGIARNMVGL